MAWKVCKDADKWRVYQLKDSGEPEVDAVACHDTEEGAAAHVRALYASEAEKSLETIDEVKIGARNSAQDMRRIQSVHDMAVELGARCEAQEEEVLNPESDSEETEDMTKAVTKTESDGIHPASHYLVVEDPTVTTSWHLRVRGADGKPDHALMGAAWAALHGGYRGNKYEGPNKPAAIEALMEMYEQEGMELPGTESKADSTLEDSDADDFVVAFGDEVKAVGEGRVSGYLVRFSDSDNTDLTGDYFTRDTDFEIEQHARTPIYYHHGMNKTLGKRRIGTGVMRIDDVGVFIEAELNLRDEYERAIAQMAISGKQGWSSGTAAHLVERISEGKARRITHWPLGVDASITPTPAEPRNGVMALKAIEDIGELDGTNRQPALEDGEAVKTVFECNQNEEVYMGEIDVNAVAAAAAEAAVKKVMDELGKEPPTVKAGFDVGGKVDPMSGAEEKPFKSLGDQLQAVHRAAMPGMGVDPRLYAVKGPAGLNESLPSEGGFLVQTDFSAELWRRTYDIGQIARRVRRIPISQNANGLRMNAIAESSRATGSRWGGVQVYWLMEGGVKTPTKPAFRQVELSLKKVAGVCYATDELLSDAIALQAVINQAFPEEMNFAVEDAIINGTGAGQPLGVMNAPCLVTVAKESGQVADTIVVDNIKKMWSRMYAPSRANSVWLINQDVEPQLWSLVESIGTGGVPVYLPPGGLSQQPFSTLFGRPVIPVEYCQTLGDLGDIVLADFSQYVLIDKGGIDAASSIHVRFLYDEQTFRFVYRVDGQPLWEAALTPKNGSNTTGPFVTLAARA